MLRALMQEVIKQPYFVIEGHWRKVLPDYWSPEARYKSEFGFLRNMSREKVKNELHNIFRNYAQKKMTHLMEDVSFPFNHPRNPLRRADISDFIDLVSDQVDLKFLVLYRNPVSATYSGIRRGFTRNVYEQARIVEDNLIYIDKSLSVYDQNLYRTLVFEDFLKDPHAYLEGLADWLDLDYSLLAQGVQNLREPYALEAIPKKISTVLTDFFSENRIRMWESLYSADHQIPKSK
jgi:hypothetical protein